MKNYARLISDGMLAENSATRGAMVIKPYGFALWENIREVFDAFFKKTGHQNAYFPLLIPVNHFTKEAKHVEAFAKECAVVTHYRLKKGEDGKITTDPKAQLEEALVIRPSSETIIWPHFKKWITSHRDLPLLINQWANVVRWEMRTRPFLRTCEFLWQEGHTAHASAEEAIEEAQRIHEGYRKIMEEHLAIPVRVGEKPPHDRFAGAMNSYTLEGLMQDGKALQMGTSHFLGQNFAKAFDVQYTGVDGERSFVWGTSWGVTTRLIGAIVMVHGDERGIILPPWVAPTQVVIIPIHHKECPIEELMGYANKIKMALEGGGVRVKVDGDDNHRPGWKYNRYEKQGVPIRLAIGPRDLANGVVEMVRRDVGTKESVSLDTLQGVIKRELKAIQQRLYDKALKRQQEMTHLVDDWKTFQEIFKKEKGFVLAHWDGTTQTADAIQTITQATIRCLPMDGKMQEGGKCIFTGNPSRGRVLFAQAY